MTKKSILSTIAEISLLMVGMTPIALCFGFLANDASRFAHNIIVVGFYSLVIGLVTFVWSLME